VSCRPEWYLGYICQPGTCVPSLSVSTTYHPTSSIFSSMGSNSLFYESVFSSNERETLQLLNNRLAAYLERVRQLEWENVELERQLQEACEFQEPTVGPNYFRYFQIIEELQQKILYSKAENARIVVQIDNTKLAADDFRSKYEMELGLRQLVEADTNGLRRILDELTLCKADLEMQVESLKEELMCLKKNHEEDDALRCQLGDRLNIEVDAVSPVDLNKVLEEMRCRYEALVETNRRDVEEWFNKQMEELNQQVVTSSEQLQSYQSDIIDLKRTVNTLEIELQTQHSLRDSLENTLTETEARHGSQLAQMQGLVTNESPNWLRSARPGAAEPGVPVLLDVRARLEVEINTYRGLLDSEDCKLPGNPCSTPSQPPCAPAPSVPRTLCVPRTVCVPCVPCHLSCH
uniref:Keratin 32 n=1 Tax=Bos mutus grunniens TaxID=30521 RepID=A0A8B9XCP2_BOSMU